MKLDITAFALAAALFRDNRFAQRAPKAAS